ncbi:RES family NAD+ phosphorylase [Streptomyces sp. AC1-42W]|uniref:RES family NAD+ phosphorylase n=1 Tax=Streptomyces sp. AC1-42W TaxID=2218666 RepID=UPI000DAF35F9|nr:RES family NAD+ phosphorylase [Streptomyces sp. AC1-42W]PZT83326.1 RES domain-containing protein [Streptomyces sp. AC1-42W]
MHEITVSPSAYRFQPHWEVLPAGTQLWRAHPSRFAAVQFRPYDQEDRAPGRFHSTAEDPYPCLYAADGPETALAETLLRSIAFDRTTGTRFVPKRAVTGRSLTVLQTRHELRLVSLRTGAALAAVCQDNRLLENEGPEHYRGTRDWAREIRTQVPGAQGMIWDSKRNPSGRVLVLFGDRLAGGPADPYGRDESDGSDGSDGPGGSLEHLAYRGIPDLGSEAGVKEVNQLLRPLRSAIDDRIRR